MNFVQWSSGHCWTCLAFRHESSSSKTLESWPERFSQFAAFERQRKMTSHGWWARRKKRQTLVTLSSCSIIDAMKSIFVFPVQIIIHYLVRWYAEHDYGCIFTGSSSGGHRSIRRDDFHPFQRLLLSLNGPDRCVSSCAEAHRWIKETMKRVTHCLAHRDLVSSGSLHISEMTRE